MVRFKVGHKLYALRQEKKLTQDRMAELVGVSATSYSRLEKGETSIEFEKLVGLAQELNIPIQDLLPETLTIENTAKNNKQGGVNFGNYYYYSSETELTKELEHKNALLEQEIKFLKEKIQLLEDTIKLLGKS